MNKYFKLDELDQQEIPKKSGYKTNIVKDEINNIGYFEFKKTSELIQIEVLKQKLFDTDYKAIKYAEGLISEEEYLPIKEQRQSWRDRINELEEELEG